MRVSIVCLMVAILMLAVAPLAVCAQEETANQPLVAAPPATLVVAPTGSAETEGSFLDVNLYLSVQDVFQILARIGAIPQAAAEQALAASKGDTAGGDASYVKITVHMRLSEIAPLAAAMGSIRSRPAPMRHEGMRPEPPAAARRLPPPPAPPAPPAKKPAK
jgi:hypothetical protein